jgi:hypothetical protein
MHPMTTTMACPACGSEYLSGVERCFDCDVALVPADADRPDGEGSSGDRPVGRDGDVDDVYAELRHLDDETPDHGTSDDGTFDDDGLVASGILGGEGGVREAPLVSRGGHAGDRDGDQDSDDDDDGDAGGSGGARRQVEYHLHEWSAEHRAMLEQLVTGAGVAHVWAGATMVVTAADEARVDGLLEQVELSDEVALDPMAEKTVYEVSDWSMDQLGVLLGALGDAGIPHEFDVEGDLAVLAEDEDRVEELLDTLEFGEPESAIDAGESDPDDGIETAEILSDLFVACDRLQNDATDHAGVLGGVDAVNRLEGRPLPFGFGPALWNDIVAQGVALRAAIEDDAVDDLDLMDQARALRTLLRQYV